MRFAASLVLIALAATSVAAARASENPPQSLVCIEGRTADGKAGIASGIIIEAPDGLTIVTAAHIAQLTGLRVTTMLGEHLRVAAFRPIPGYDLALVWTEPARLSYIAAREAPASLEDATVTVWGFPLTRAPTASGGTVIATAMIFPDDPTRGHLALACATCGHGDSGGGVFAPDGRLLGIVTARWTSHSRAIVQAESLASVDVALRVARLP